VEPLPGPVYILAADHRWQWEDWCDARGVPRARIGDVKRIALDGLLLARQRSAGGCRHAAFLVDQQYGGAEIDRARRAGLVVGTPVERAKTFPLEWAADPFWAAAPGGFAKVLVRHQPEWPDSVHRAQLEKLRTLGEWCRAHARLFLLEVLVMTADDERADRLARFIRDAYAHGVVPGYWKVEGTTQMDAMARVDAAVAEQPSPKVVILGKAADFDTIGQWFRAAAAASRAAGFAIGRSVYWEPAADFLSAAIDEAAAVQRIADNYLRVIDAWTAARHE
jgi:5-dehydro-2-deoxygluconokinase